jgi:hypothetical protein
MHIMHLSGNYALFPMKCESLSAVIYCRVMSITGLLTATVVESP